MQRFVNIEKAPTIKFKDLDAVVNSTIRYNLLPMQVRTDYIPVTESSVLDQSDHSVQPRRFAVPAERRFGGGADQLDRAHFHHDWTPDRPAD